MRTSQAEMGHQQSPTTVEMENIAANRIVNETREKIYIQSNRHDILLGQR